MQGVEIWEWNFTQHDQESAFQKNILLTYKLNYNVVLITAV